MVRILQVIFLCLLLMFLGFCAGAYMGSFFIPEGSGLAGPPITFTYGIAGLFIGLLAGIVLARFRRHSSLRKALIIIILFSLLVCGLIIYRIKVPMHQQTRFENLNAFIYCAVFYETEVQLTPGAGIAKAHPIPGNPFYFR